MPGARAGVSACITCCSDAAAPALRAVPATCGACSHSSHPQPAARTVKVDSLSASNSASACEPHASATSCPASRVKWQPPCSTCSPKRNVSQASKHASSKPMLSARRRVASAVTHLARRACHPLLRPQRQRRPGGTHAQRPAAFGAVAGSQRGHVLQEEHLPTRAQHARHFPQRTRRVSRAAQLPSKNDCVHAGIWQRQGLGIALEHAQLQARSAR